ncbi:MAG: ribbon-helix-helix domain-containing protein [Chloroflexi bacterium]|nr:ribbon-helix-helix domain-containing protein [Chloroflexota bacterium]
MNVAVALEKVTVSLPRDLVDYATEKARRSGVSRSRVIAEALEERKAREEEQLAAEGYRFYAAEAEGFAQSSARAVSEATHDAG